MRWFRWIPPCASLRSIRPPWRCLAFLRKRPLASGSGDAFAEPCYREALGEVLDQTLLTGKGIREYTVECPSRERPGLTLVVTCAPLLDSEGKFIGAVLIVRGHHPSGGVGAGIDRAKVIQAHCGQEQPHAGTLPPSGRSRRDRNHGAGLR